MKYPKSINNLIESFKKLPGVGEKTAERYALSFLEMNQDAVNTFSTSMIDVKNKIIKCKKCGNLSEDDLCEVCKDESRDKTLICVVEESKNIISFEKAGTYRGLYHVLNGLISPIDGINPEDINLSALLNRVETENIKEIIIAVKPCVEGEVTALYISKTLEGNNVVVSKIAYGIPLGADMGYMDPLTLELSLENRQELS